MGKIFLYVVLVLGVVGGLVIVANSQNSSKSLRDVINSLPATPIPTVATQAAPSQAPQAVQQQPQQQQQTPRSTEPKQQAIDPAQAAQQFLEQMASKSAVIKTTKGDITMSFYTQDAINTVYNFVNKVQGGFYNNLTFHRVEDWVVQGGDPLGNGTGGNSNMPVEFNNHPFVVGSVGVASKGDGRTQNDAQFFITKKESSWLNGQYTNFGIVTKGIDVVEKIQIGDKILGIEIK